MEYKNLLIALSNFSKSLATNVSYDKKNINQITASVNAWKKAYKNSPVIKYKIGDVYKIEFGLAYKPELAFEHRGIIIGKKDNLYYVVPITTLNSKIHINSYHPTDNRTGNRKYFLMKAYDNDFLDHDSVIKCNDIKTVSYLRINRKVGSISDELLQEITYITFKNIFPTIDYKYNNLMNENIKIKKEIAEIKCSESFIIDSSDKTVEA